MIIGAEEQIISEMKTVHPDWSEEELYQHALVQSSGKLVLIAKLLPKLRADGHKVLIFSQMVRVLDIIEEFLVVQKYVALSFMGFADLAVFSVIGLYSRRCCIN